MVQYLLALRINFVTPDTSTGPQSVNLAQIDAQMIIVKDVAGNATANPITIIGTVDGVVDPTVGTDYGVLKIFSYNGTWQSF